MSNTDRNVGYLKLHGSKVRSPSVNYPRILVSYIARPYMALITLGLHSDKITTVHKLTASDCPKRLMYCRWFLEFVGSGKRWLFGLSSKSRRNALTAKSQASQNSYYNWIAITWLQLFTFVDRKWNCLGSLSVG